MERTLFTTLLFAPLAALHGAASLVCRAGTSAASAPDDAPAQVNIYQFHLPLPATAAQLRKDAPDEDVPLAGEVPEGRTDEEADRAGGGHAEWLVEHL